MCKHVLHLQCHYDVDSDIVVIHSQPTSPLLSDVTSGDCRILFDTCVLLYHSFEWYCALSGFDLFCKRPCDTMPLFRVALFTSGFSMRIKI